MRSICTICTVAQAPQPQLLQTLLVGLDHLLDHLAADGAGFTGGQVTVVAVGQVDSHFLSCLHLELLHGLLGLGNVDLVVALHNNSLLCRFPGKQVTFRLETTFLSASLV